MFWFEKDSQKLSIPPVKCSSYKIEFSIYLKCEHNKSVPKHTVLVLKRPYKYSQIIELENCRASNFLKFYIQFWSLKALKGATLTNLVLNMVLWPCSTDSVFIDYV